MSDQPSLIVCEHGSLKRQCRICELEAEVEQLRQQVADYEDVIHVIKSMRTKREGEAIDALVDARVGTTSVESFYARVNARAGHER